MFEFYHRIHAHGDLISWMRFHTGVCIDLAALLRLAANIETETFPVSWLSIIAKAFHLNPRGLTVAAATDI
jgi:hypothetical protein